MQRSQVRRYEGVSTASTEIQAMRIGGLALVAMPGEPFAEVGVRIRRRSPFGVTRISGYSNGEIGYVPMRSDYKSGGYGAWSSRLPPGSAEPLIDAAGDLLDPMSGPAVRTSQKHSQHRSRWVGLAVRMCQGVPT